MQQSTRRYESVFNPMRLLRNILFACVALLLIAGTATGCARQGRPAVKPLHTTMLIMDFSVPEAYDPASVVKAGGWWFGAYRDYRNPNAGEQFADVLTLQLRAEAGDWVSLFDRLRLRQYFARKRALLANEFAALAPEEIDRLMEQTPPEAFARDLGADKVLVGHIDSTMKKNSATHFTRSRVSLQASLIDVDTGRVLWQYEDSETEVLKSEMSVYEQLAERMVESMMEEYFFRTR